MTYYIHVIVQGVNDSILGNLKDLLSDCERDCMVGASQLTQVSLRITFGKRITCSCG